MDRLHPFPLPLTFILGLLVVVSMLVSVPAFPVTYTVDPTGDDANLGDAADPWRTVQHAAVVASAGDRIVVHAGIYTESVVVSRSGTPDNPITFAADPGAILVSPNPTASMEAIDVAPGAGYITLANIEATGGFDETIFLRDGAHDISIEGCNLYGNHAGIIMDNASNVTVEHCSLHNNSTLGLRVAGGSHDVVVNDTDSFMNAAGVGCNSLLDGFTTEVGTTGVTFNRSRAYDNSGDGFDLQGDRMVLNDVTSTGNGCTGIKLYQNAIVRGCLAVSNNRGLAVTSVGGGSAVDIAQCTVAANNGVALDLTTPWVPNATFNVQLRNSILAGDFKAVQYVGAARFSESHNLLYRPSSYDPVIAPVTGHRTTGHEINVTYPKTAMTTGSATLAVDPLFVDPANGDFHVISSSAAVGRGVPIDGTVTPPNIGLFQDPVGPTNHSPWADAGRDRTGRVHRWLLFVATGSLDPDYTPLSYSWDFGDGTGAASGFRASHAYSAPGTFVVTLTVSDGSLLDHATIQATIR